MNQSCLVLRIAVALLSMVFAVPTVFGANTQDVTVPIHQFIDGFNTGDVKSAYAAYASGDIVIIDDVAPHLWRGPHAAQDWASDFDKMAKAESETDTLVKYGAPTHTEVERDVAYVVIPTVYTFKKNGQPMTEKGQMTFVLHAENGAWKIAAWTWTGTKPRPQNESISALVPSSER